MSRPIAWLLLAAATAVTCAQQNIPHAAYVYPAGGQLGTTFDVTVGGQFLYGARAAETAGGGIQAKVVGFTRPLRPAERDELRTELQKIVRSHGGVPSGANRQFQKQIAAAASAPSGGTPDAEAVEAPLVITPWTPEDRRRALELRDKLQESQRLRSAPALSETVTLRITVAAHATLGNHELRLVTAQGLTNPLPFFVGQLPELSRPPLHVPLELAAGGGLPLNSQAHAASSAAPLALALPVIVNGQMMPGAVDRYSFHAVRGQHILIAAQTRALIPYMSDAVPGWFQAALTLFGPRGEKLASADHFRFSQEPIIDQQIAEDGDYLLAVHDILYRGREDFVYRIAIGELPYVTDIFPLGARKGAHAQVELTGWNLPSARFKPSTRQAGLEYLQPGQDGWAANPIPFAVDTQSESVLNKPAASIRDAKRISVPAILDGRIAHPGDTAVFRLDARAGEDLVVEVEARRLGSPLDSTLTLSDASGRQLGFNDDFDDKGAALLTQQTDSLLTYHFTARGTYYLQLADAQGNGGPAYAYRLRLRQPHPDFELRVTPSSLNLRPGTTAPATVHLLRRDGFQGEVNLRVTDAPLGMKLGGGEIPAGVDSVRVTLTAPATATVLPHRLALEGEAQIDGHKVRHTGVPADDWTQAFAWSHLVCAQEGLVLVLGNSRRNSLWRTEVPRIRIPVGGVTEVRVDLPFAQLAKQMKLALNDPPEGITLLSVTPANGALVLRLRGDAKLEPGEKGNLIVDASFLRRLPVTDSRPNANRPLPLGTLPAIPFEIVLPSSPPAAIRRP